MISNLSLIPAAAFAVAVSLTSIPGAAMADDAPSFTPDKAHTAVLITDPQNDFMSTEGKAWGLVGDNVTRLGTNDHIEALIRAAKQSGMTVVVSPHTYYGTDDQWQDRGPVQGLLHSVGAFKVAGATAYDGFEGSGADFYGPLKEMILDGQTVITSPHKVYGPESNDLALQLRQRGIQTVILGGFAANLCVDSHMRELTEQGFSVVVVKDAVGAPGEAAYDAAMLNAGMIADAVWSTEEALAFIE
ncbi:MAG: cysteine hydrolase [Paracoccaceae bacterium]